MNNEQEIYSISYADGLNFLLVTLFLLLAHNDVNNFFSCGDNQLICFAWYNIYESNKHRLFNFYFD